MTQNRVKPGLIYVLFVFAAGFLFGTLRTIWLGPMLGPVAAVAIELPFILGVSWIACGWCMRRYAVATLRQRTWMGVTAFSILMATEALLSVLMFGRSPDDYASAFLTPAGLLGLAGQVAFGAMPLFHPGKIDPASTSG